MKHPNPRNKRAAAVVGIGHTDWVADWARCRAGERPNDSYGYGIAALRNALADAKINRDEIDGLIAGPTTAYERMGELTGINPRWGGQADAVLAVERRGRDDLLEARQLAGAPPQHDFTVADDRDAGRIVAAVFETAQPVDENGDDLLGTDVSDDPAHAA